MTSPVSASEMKVDTQLAETIQLANVTSEKIQQIEGILAQHVVRMSIPEGQAFYDQRRAEFEQLHTDLKKLTEKADMTGKQDLQGLSANLTFRYYLILSFIRKFKF